MSEMVRFWAMEVASLPYHLFEGYIATWWMAMLPMLSSHNEVTIFALVVLLLGGLRGLLWLGGLKVLFGLPLVASDHTANCFLASGEVVGDVKELSDSFGSLCAILWMRLVLRRPLEKAVMMSPSWTSGSKLFFLEKHWIYSRWVLPAS